MKDHPFFVTLNLFQGPFCTLFHRSNFRGCSPDFAKSAALDSEA